MSFMIDASQNTSIADDAASAAHTRRGRRPGAAETKWGAAISGGPNGYQLVPDVLLRKQTDLKLDATDIVILLNICMHWWESEPGKMPHPRPVTIAKRMGISTRTVERHLARLGDLGLLEWLPPEPRVDAPSVRRFDLEGIRSALERLAYESSGEETKD
jgi:hypothetical protein